MTDPTRRRHEVAAILMAAVAGEATEADLARLDEWIRADGSLAAFVVELMHQEAWLSWQRGLGADGPTPAVGEILALAEAAREAGPARRGNAPRPTTRQRARTRALAAAAGLAPRAMAAVFLIGAGAVLGSVATRLFDRREPDLVVAVASPEVTPGAQPYVARFVHGTACRWNSETTTPFGVDEALRSGESLNLLEGLAEVRFDWSGGQADLKLEGPAGLVLTAERGASLSRGRLTADVRIDDGAFVLETPSGEIEASRDASIGVAVRGDVVELHVFRGAATFVSPQPGAQQQNYRLDAAAGQAITIASDAEGRTQLEHGASRPDDFVSQLSMGSDDLPITPEYVDEVLNGQPLIYWRFEGDDALVRNEAGDRYQGCVVGAVKHRSRNGNKDVELGAELTNESLHAYIVSTEPLAADFRHGYTLEVWIKPSHYHWGTVASLLGASSQPDAPSVHGMLFELGGPITYPSSIERPGRVRFLHRSPPGNDLSQGTSCFSESPYELRKWQHVAAVKDGSQMRLYVNGQLAAAGDDASELPSGLKLVVGQLDEFRREERRFVGQLDELAVYARPLSAEEIQRRYQMVRRPDAPAKPVHDSSI